MAVITLPFATLASKRRAPTSTELTDGIGCSAFDINLHNEMFWLGSRLGWLTINGVSNAPPVSPVIGAFYLIDASPTGVWATHGGKIAQWDGNDWICFVAPLGHILADNSKAENDPLRYLKLTGGGWISATATDAAFGFARRATSSEITARNGVGFITSADLNAIPATAFRLDTPTMSIPPGVFTRLSNFGNAVISPTLGSSVSASTGIFNVAANDAGWWTISAGGSTNGLTDWEEIFIWVNGLSVAYQMAEFDHPKQRRDLSVTTVIRLNAGDEVSVSYYQNNPWAETRAASIEKWVFFAGIKGGV